MRAGAVVVAGLALAAGVTAGLVVNNAEQPVEATVPAPLPSLSVAPVTSEPTTVADSPTVRPSATTPTGGGVSTPRTPTPTAVRTAVPPRETVRVVERVTTVIQPPTTTGFAGPTDLPPDPCNQGGSNETLPASCSPRPTSNN